MRRFATALVLMFFSSAIAGVTFAGGASAASAEASDAQRFSTVDGDANPFGPLLARNRATDLGGIQAVCGGADAATRGDARWETYPLKLEFTGPGDTFLTFAHVSLTDLKGQGVLSVRCPGAWLLLGLPAGEYKALVGTPGAPDQTVGFVVPPTGQKTLVVRFPAATAGR